MLAVELIMIAIGLGAVIFSFRVSGEPSETNADSTPVRSEDSKQVREEMEQYKEELINSASEELSRISNDKLLGMNEYSEEDTNRQPDEAQKKKKNKNLKSTQAQKLTKDLEKKSRAARETVEEDDSEDVASENPNNHNAEIIKLYKEGNSVFDISKLLSIGQGEVKLVIDLYKASR